MSKKKKFIPTHFFINCIDCGTLVKKFGRKEKVTTTLVCQGCGAKIRVYLNNTFHYTNNQSMFSEIFCHKEMVFIIHCIFKHEGET